MYSGLFVYGVAQGVGVAGLFGEVSSFIKFRDWIRSTQELHSMTMYTVPNDLNRVMSYFLILIRKCTSLRREHFARSQQLGLTLISQDEPYAVRAKFDPYNWTRS